MRNKFGATRSGSLPRMRSTACWRCQAKRRFKMRCSLSSLPGRLREAASIAQLRNCAKSKQLSLRLPRTWSWLPRLRFLRRWCSKATPIIKNWPKHWCQIRWSIVYRPAQKRKQGSRRCVSRVCSLSSNKLRSKILDCRTGTCLNSKWTMMVRWKT